MTKTLMTCVLEILTRDFESSLALLKTWIVLKLSRMCRKALGEGFNPTLLLLMT